MATTERPLRRARKLGFGVGLLKGMVVTLKHLFKHNTVIQYPDEKQDLGPRTRGVIALKEENCTVCMLCARECPDWCIYIDSHKESLPPKREGGRPRKRNVLDRFAIDYALCMYCGICVEVCPYDALFWSREFEYAEYDIRELTHEKERLSDWMSTVLPPPALDEGAEQPGVPARAMPAGREQLVAAPPSTAPPPTGAATPGAPPTLAPEKTEEATEERLPPPQERPQTVETTKEPEAAGAAGPGTAQRPASPAEEAAAQEEPAQAQRVPTPTETAEAPPKEEPTPSQVAAGEAEGAAPAEEKAPEGARDERVPNVEVPHEARRPQPLQPAEDPEAVYQSVLEEQKEKGSSPQVAEARARVARAKAERGIRRGPTPVETEKQVPSAPTKAEQEGASPEPTASGAATSEAPSPEPGPVAPTSEEEKRAEGAGAGGGPPQSQSRDEDGAGPDRGTAQLQSTDEAGGGETPEQVYERVLAEERAKGSSDAVAQGRAKAARVRAERKQKGAG
jgi:formate hydrogenlyase subunit 6/NADH:ubiquinone oxidoreductase subunit I